MSRFWCERWRLSARDVAGVSAAAAASADQGGEPKSPKKARGRGRGSSGGGGVGGGGSEEGGKTGAKEAGGPRTANSLEDKAVKITSGSVNHGDGKSEWLHHKGSRSKV
jgi:hypothetical protein